MSLTVRAQKRKRKKIIRLTAFFLLILTLIIFFFVRGLTNISHVKQKRTLNSTATITHIPDNTPTIDLSQSSIQLGNAVQGALIGTHGSYGVVVENLKTNEKYFQDPQKQYIAGSLYKLWVMAAVYQQIKQGKLHENDILIKDASILNREFGIDPNDAEKTAGMVTYSVKDALYQMITISDNYAALLLTDKIGISTLTSFLSKYGFTGSRLGLDGQPPVTTALDIANFFEKLYSGKLIDKSSSDKMTSLLKQQKLNDKIPEYLPFDVTVAHKTGELDNVTHDAGIVYGPSGDYIIVVLSEIDDRQLANERIANVSKAVYLYFNPDNSQ